MKTYGVNWFLVWMGLLVFMIPLYAWLDLFLFSHWHSPSDSHALAMSQGFGQPLCWTFLFYYIHGKTLSDPKAIERLRQSLQRSKGRRGRRYRWPIMWVTLFAVVGTASTVCRLIFGSPSWLHVAGYSLLLPCSSLAAMWLIDTAARKGQLAQLLKGGEEVP